jgi:N-acyl-D-aspartate/D-glutamate deacylase
MIVAMGKLPGKTARRTIDATGLTVSPGFIDIHNHSDYTILRDPDAESMVRQGVTTMILGEGGSAAPIGGKQDHQDASWDWTDFQGYFGRLLRQGISTNIGSQTPPASGWLNELGRLKGGCPGCSVIAR